MEPTPVKPIVDETLPDGFTFDASRLTSLNSELLWCSWKSVGKQTDSIIPDNPRRKGT